MPRNYLFWYFSSSPWLKKFWILILSDAPRTILGIFFLIMIEEILNLDTLRCPQNDLFWWYSFSSLLKKFWILILADALERLIFVIFIIFMIDEILTSDTLRCPQNDLFLWYSSSPWLKMFWDFIPLEFSKMSSFLAILSHCSAQKKSCTSYLDTIYCWCARHR